VAVVTTVPDRWGGDPADWWGLAGELAVEGLLVVVTCTDASALQVAGAPWAHPWSGPPPVALGSVSTPSTRALEETLP
jgi:hypothetical protein